MTTGRKILVIKHGALGDIVQALDGFASLRAGHKDDHLAVLTSPGFAGLLSMMPYFDEVLVDHRAGPLQLVRNVSCGGCCAGTGTVSMIFNHHAGHAAIWTMC